MNNYIITLTPADAMDLLKPPFSYGFKINNVRSRLFKRRIGADPKKVNHLIKAIKRGDYRL